jgi:HSP20 family protein
MNTRHCTPRPVDAPTLASREFDRLFRSAAAGRFDAPEGAFGVPLNLYETPTGYLVRAAAPGVDPTAIEVAVEDRELAIGFRRAVVEQAGRKVHAERPLGDVTRRVRLGRAVDPQSVTATCRDGVLEVVLPFAAPPRRIDVATA